MTKGGKSGGRDSSTPEDSVSIEISIDHTGEDAEVPDETPLPRAIPFHVAEPTTASVRRRVAEPEPDLPLSEGAETRPGSDDAVLPQVSGIANAARRISASLGVLDEDDPGATLETRRVPRFDTDEDDDTLTPPPLMVTSPIQRFEDDIDDDALLTPPPIEVPEPAADEAPFGEPTGRTASQVVLAGRFFAPLPPDKRGAVLDRFTTRSVTAGTTVIRQGEVNHPLVLVAEGRLEVRVDLASGPSLQIATVSPGEFIGEAALLARTPASAHVIALTRADLLLLAPRDLYELAGAFPALWAELKDLAERRTREHDRRVKKR